MTESDKNLEESGDRPVVNESDSIKEPKLVESRLVESTLIEAVQQGDQKAFGQLVRMHQKRLFRTVYAMIGSFDQTEDIVQETFVKAYNAIGTFKTGYAFYPWLAKISRNIAINQIHRDEKKESLDQLTEHGFDIHSPELGPFQELLDSENQKRFFEALQSMPSKYRAVFTLRHMEDMDYSEIASYLNIPPGTVDSRLYRARKYLMDKLQDLFE